MSSPEKYFVHPAELLAVYSDKLLKEGTSMTTHSSSSLEKAKDLAVRAVSQDSEGHYEEAVISYKEAISHFRTVKKGLDKQDHPKKVRIGLKEKIQLCSQRLRTLQEHLLMKEDLSPLFQEVVSSQGCHLKEKELTTITTTNNNNDYEEIVGLGGAMSISGSTHSLYPRCEIKRATSILSGASDFGLGEEIYDHPRKPPLANLENELRLSLSSLSSDEGINTTMLRRDKKVKAESDADAILVLDEDRLLETSFDDDLYEDEKDGAYVRADTIRLNKRNNRLTPDNASDSGISEERVSSSGRSSCISRNKSPELAIKEDRLSSAYSDSTYELYSECLPETRQPTRERYEYVPPRAFARSNKEKVNDGCFYLMACLDAFGVL